METIKDIVEEMRAKTAKSKDEAWYDKKKWAELCNRIEAAHEREVADALNVGAVVAAAHKRDVADALDTGAFVAAAARKVDVSKTETTTPTDKDSLQVGNSAKMREALKQIQAYASSHGLFDVVVIAETALATPPRNCDVGLVESQIKRFYVFCGDMGQCEKCPCYTKDRSAASASCYAKWSLMPYKARIIQIKNERKDGTL